MLKRRLVFTWPNVTQTAALEGPGVTIFRSAPRFRKRGSRRPIRRSRGAETRGRPLRERSAYVGDFLFVKLFLTSEKKCILMPSPWLRKCYQSPPPTPQYTRNKSSVTRLLGINIPTQTLFCHKEPNYFSYQMSINNAKISKAREV